MPGVRVYEVMGWGIEGRGWRADPHHRERSEPSPITTSAASTHRDRREPRSTGEKATLARRTGSVPIGGNRSVGFDRDQARRDGPIVAAGVAKRERLVRLRTNPPQTAKKLINDR